MKAVVPSFRGEVPIIANRLLPDGFGSSVVNANLVSGDLDSFPDIGNPFQLAKAASINAIWLMAGPPPTYWLQWSQSEVSYGTNIDASLGTIPGDTSYRTYITGIAGGPVQTNKFYSTDPSQQGANPAGAYPYVTFKLGIAAPTSPPTASQPPTSVGPTTEFDAAAERSVNNIVVNAVGSGYKSGDVVTGNQGTVSNGLHGFKVQINKVTSAGAIDTSQNGAVTLLNGGFYNKGGDPPVTGATVVGGSGTGATFNLTIVDNAFPPYSTYSVNNGAGYYITWSIDANNRWTVASGQGDLTIAYSNQTYGIKTASSWTYEVDLMDNQVASGGVPTDLIVSLMGTYGGTTSITGPAVILSDSDGTFTLYSSFSGTNGGAVSGTVVQAVSGLTINPNTFYRVSVIATAATAASAPGFQVSATLATQAAPNTILATVSGFIAYGGETFGVGTNHRGNHNNGNDGQFENILLTVTAPTSALSESTAYVYTYQTLKGTNPNAIVEESAPSTPSQVITFYLNPTTSPVTMSPVTVTIPPAPAGQSIASYNIYRLVKLTTGATVYEFVANVAASTSANVVYTDTVLDANLGAVLQSTTWSPPPTNLQDITALTNGVMAGFFGNTLCLSAQNFPFAWPVGNQLPTDSPIVAIAAIDSTVLVLTQGHPYTAWGSDPTAYSMSKETAYQGCVSKRSAVTHKRLGVIYASGNGLCYYRGQGDLDLIRAPGGTPYFSIEQWQALVPSSIIATVHDDRYWFWYNNGTVKKGYCLDLSPAGFGLIELDFHVTSVFTDPLTDLMYFTPDSSVYPINGSVVSAALNVLSQWEFGPSLRTRIWTRAELLQPRDVTFQLCQVDSEDFASVTLTLASETGTAYNAAVASPRPFILSPQPGRRWSITLTGTSRINRIQLCESSLELLPS